MVKSNSDFVTIEGFQKSQLLMIFADFVFIAHSEENCSEKYPKVTSKNAIYLLVLNSIPLSIHCLLLLLSVATDVGLPLFIQLNMSNAVK